MYGHQKILELILSFGTYKHLQTVNFFNRDNHMTFPIYKHKLMRNHIDSSSIFKFKYYVRK